MGKCKWSIDFDKVVLVSFQNHLSKVKFARKVVVNVHVDITEKRTSPQQSVQRNPRNSMLTHNTLYKLKNATQRELMRLFEGDIKTDILNSTYCSISKEHFDTKIIFILHSYQKLQII